MADRTKPWWALKGDDRARQAKVTCDAIMLYQYGRLSRARRNLSLYEGRNLNALHPISYLTDVDAPELTQPTREEIIANVARGVVSTAHTQICSKQQPKAAFCANSSDWSTKRKAKRAERCVEAVNLARQDGYADAWELYSDCMLDAICGFDQGVAKFWPEFSTDGKKGKIRIAHCLPWEVAFSVDELKHGNPQNVFHTYGYDRDVLKSIYPEFTDEIEAAPGYEADSNTSNDNVSTFLNDAGNQVKVREAWRLPIDEDTPGAHALVVGETDLLGGDEPWERPFFPFLRFMWEKQRVGGYSLSLIDIVYNACSEHSMSLDRWSQAERLCSNLYGTYVEGTVDPDFLARNDVGIWIPVKPTPENPNPQPPTWTVPNTVAEASIKYQDTVKGLIYEISGVSQGTAQGSTEPGVTAGSAMRQLVNNASGRLGMQFKAYGRKVAVEATRQILACAKEIIDAGAELQVTLVRGKQSKTYDFAENYVDLPDESIQVDEVSGLVNTAADRLQLASELLDRQIISKESYLEMIQAKSAVADLEHENETTHWIEAQIEAWLDFEPGDAEREPDDPKYFRYRAPIKFIGLDGLTDMLVRVAHEYLRADADDAPDYCLSWFEQFMGDADAMIQRLAQQQASLQALSKSSNGAAGMAGMAPPPTGPPAP
jgi:hypothetical protein